MLLVSHKSSGVSKKSFGGAHKGRSLCASPCGNCGAMEASDGPRHRRAADMAEGYLCNACYWYSKRHSGQARPLHLIMQHGAKTASKTSSPKSLPRRPVLVDFDVAEAMIKLQHSYGTNSSMIVSPPNPIMLNIEKPVSIIKIPKIVPVRPAAPNHDSCYCIEMISEDILERNLILSKLSARWQAATKNLTKEEILASLTLLGYRKHHRI